MKIAIIVIICILLFILLFAVCLDFVVMYIYRWNYRITYKMESKKGFIRNYHELEKTDYTVTSYDGYKLHCQYIPCGRESNKYVIITHGYTYTLIGSIKYMHLFREYGFNCILYDNRGHGKNKIAKCTFGINESKDLLEVIDDTRRRFGSDIVLGLHGESMGSGIGISALKYRPDIDFIVNDCGYGVLSDVLEHKLKQIFRLPPSFLKFLDFFAKHLFGYSYYDVRPIDYLKGNKIPICFMHGADDNFIDCVQSENMQKATDGYSELHLFPGADHAESIYKDEERYKRIMFAFLDKVLADKSVYMSQKQY